MSRFHSASLTAVLVTACVAAGWLLTGPMPAHGNPLHATAGSAIRNTPVPLFATAVSPPNVVLVRGWSSGGSGQPRASTARIVLIIRTVFGSHGSEAVRVARCESGLRTTASNHGRYLGLFQLGPAERARFGHGPDAWTQSRAAFRYYRLAGWRPWSCKP